MKIYSSHKKDFFGDQMVRSSNSYINILEALSFGDIFYSINSINLLKHKA